VNAPASVATSAPVPASPRKSTASPRDFRHGRERADRARGHTRHVQERAVQHHRFTTVVGGLQAIPMSDGSRVTLNTNSDISISLDSRERVVEIDHGEAYFEVAHDPNRPFVVKAGDRSR